MQDSIFTKIIKGDIPCHKVYEDDATLAFLDIHPVQPGHVLVIPKVQVEFVWDLEKSDYQALMSSVKKVARRLQEVSDKKYVSSRIVGVDVPHAHVHVIPFTAPEELRAHQRFDTEPDHAALAEVAKRLYFE